MIETKEWSVWYLTVKYDKMLFYDCAYIKICCMSVKFVEKKLIPHPCPTLFGIK